MARSPAKKKEKEKEKKATAVGCTTRISDTREYHMLMRYLSYHLALLGPSVYLKGTVNFTYFVAYRALN